MATLTLGKRLKNGWALAKEIYENWDRQDPFMVSAGISYYAIFSLPAMLVVIVTIAGYFFKQELVSGQLYRQIGGLIGPQGATQVQEMIESTLISENTIWATSIAVVTMLVSATAMFAQLQKTINRIWGLEPAPDKALMSFVMSRVFSFGMIASIAFLLLISLALSALITAFSEFIQSYFSPIAVVIVRLVDLVVELGLYTAIFMVMFKVLPDAKVKWSTVRAGAFFTAVLFQLGRWGIGYYLGQSNPGSTYGAAGSVILILLWVSYSTMILMAGAVYTKIIADRRGHQIEPDEYVVPTTRFYSSAEANNAEQKFKQEDIKSCQLRKVGDKVIPECD